MYEIRRTPAARAAERVMPESLSVAFGAFLEEVAEDPWSAGDPYGLEPTEMLVGSFGLNARGLVLYRVATDDESPHVLVLQLLF